MQTWIKITDIYIGVCLCVPVHVRVHIYLRVDKWADSGGRKKKSSPPLIMGYWAHNLRIARVTSQGIKRPGPYGLFRGPDVADRRRLPSQTRRVIRQSSQRRRRRSQTTPPPPHPPHRSVPERSGKPGGGGEGSFRSAGRGRPPGAWRPGGCPGMLENPAPTFLLFRAPAVSVSTGNDAA